MSKEPKLDLKGWLETASPEFIQKLRNAACPEGQQTLWLHKSLNDGQLVELYYRIFKHDEDLRDVALLVKKDWEVKPKWQLRDFIPGLKKWKAALSTTFSEYKETAETPKALIRIQEREKVQKKLSEELDILEKLAYAVEVNYKRLQMVHDRELQAKIPLNMTDSVTRTFAHICAAYTEQAVKTGVIEQRPSELNINLKKTSDLVLNKYIGDSGQKMIKATHAFLAEAAKHVVTMNLDPETGEYVLAGKSAHEDTNA